MMVIIGITGPTGAGKTTALHELNRLGGMVIDCDAVYHALLAQDQNMRQELEARFGDLTTDTGTFDRKKLGTLVFHNSTALTELNAIVHPYIIRDVEKQLHDAQTQGRSAAAVDAVALFESGLSGLCDTTVAIVAPAEMRIRRIMKREHISEEYARARVMAQNPEEFYTSRCQYVLRNDTIDRETFRQSAHSLFQTILQSTPLCPST